MPDKKHILIYGDSLTWGLIPAKRERYGFKDRWPQVCERGLDGLARITTQALPGRTTIHDEPERADRNGRTSFLMELECHSPIDLVVIMLGVNDLQNIYHSTAVNAAAGVGLIANDALNFVLDAQLKPPKVLIVAPSLLLDENEPFYPVMEGAYEKSLALAKELSKVAAELGCEFFDVSNLITASRDDGCHLDLENTRILGEAMARPIKEILGECDE